MKTTLYLLLFLPTLVFAQTNKDESDINKKKLPLLKESNKLVAEVGPIKYVGDMIYGMEDDTAIDKAVRLVIMLIMVVFDNSMR